MIIAGYYDNVHIIDAQIDACADVNVQDNKGFTALMNAAYKGHGKVVARQLRRLSENQSLRCQ